MLNKAIGFELNGIEFELVISRHLYIRLGRFERMIVWRDDIF